MGVKRYYRHALQAATLAVEEWEQQGDDVLFVAQLGDIIDGFNKREGIEDESLDNVLSVLGRLAKPLHHVVGNHEVLHTHHRFDLSLCSRLLLPCRKIRTEPCPHHFVRCTILAGRLFSQRGSFPTQNAPTTHSLPTPGGVS